MEKKKCFFIFTVLVVFLVFSNVVFSQDFTKKAAVEVNKIVMLVTLPDGTKLKATVSENQDLVISTSDALTKFRSSVVDFEKKLVNTVTFETSGDFARILNNGENSIKFEILDIVKMANITVSSNCATCCVSCNGFTACACSVLFPECDTECCCNDCCPKNNVR